MIEYTYMYLNLNKICLNNQVKRNGNAFVFKLLFQDIHVLKYGQ